MRLVDILFVLTAATTVNAILIQTDNDGSPKASVTSSQAFGPTDKPSPEIPDEDWKSIVDAINSSIFSQDWQDPIDQPSPSTSSQDQQQPMDQPIPNTSDEYWKSIMNEIRLTTPEDWKEIVDAVNSQIYDQDQQQTIDVVDPSTPKRGRKRPIDVVDPNTSKRGRKRPADQPSPSTSRQDQQQPINEDESANTVPNQVTVLSQRYQRTFNRIKKRLVTSKEIQKKKWKEYREYADLKFSQQLALAMGKEISEPMHNPEVEKRLKEEYEKARRKIYAIRRNLKNYMAKHGLESQEPKVDSD
ncbi:hypothetical protein QVD99_005600 [Batrachochytrium dendrobatidis]|nr:hypothetical protein QVD99_005600 [Batrachochytrium dendrobatidis]